MNQEQRITETLTEDKESRVFEFYEEPLYSFKTFEVNNDEMNGGRIRDTPVGALILGKAICIECLDEVMPRAIYGFILSYKGGFIHKDVAVLDKETGTLICSGRNPETANREIGIKLDEVVEIFEVVKRCY